MRTNNKDINNIKNDIKSIKIMFLGLLITTPIYYTSIYFLSKNACKKAFLIFTEYINNVEKNCNLQDRLDNVLINSDSNSEENDLDSSSYSKILSNKRSFFNFSY
jgi:hypothetical protein